MGAIELPLGAMDGRLEEIELGEIETPLEAIETSLGAMAAQTKPGSLQLALDLLLGAPAMRRTVRMNRTKELEHP
jgi:hypothetical protein